MPIKLIGTEPYQVPRNSDLGTMAYQDATSIGVGAITATGGTVNLITAYSYDNSATITAQTTTSAGNVASLVLKSPVGNYGLYVADNTNAVVLHDYTANAQRLRINSTGQMFLGSTTASTNVQFRIGKSLTGSTTSYAIHIDGQVASDATTNGTYINTNVSTAGAVSSLIHYNASQATLSGTVDKQYGFVVQNSVKDATTNYGFFVENAAAVTSGKTHYAFYSGNAIATGGGTTWNYYASGTAPNYFAGNTLIGTTTDFSSNTSSGGAVVSGVGVYPYNAESANGWYVGTPVSLVVQNPTAYTLTGNAGGTHLIGTMFAPVASHNGAGTGSSFLQGITVGPVLTSSTATSNLKIRGAVIEAGRYSASDLSTNAANQMFGIVAVAQHRNTLPNTSSTTSLQGVRAASVVDSGIAAYAQGVGGGVNIGWSASANTTSITTRASAFEAFNINIGYATGNTSTVAAVAGLYVTAATINATATVTNFYGVCVEPPTVTGTLTNAYGMYSNIASGTNRYNFYAAGTADNYFAGNVGIGAANPSGVKLYVGITQSTGSGTTTPTVLALDNTYGTNTRGKNLKIKVYSTTTSTADAGLGISSGLLEVTTTSGGDIAFFKNAASPTELVRITSDAALLVNTSASRKVDTTTNLPLFMVEGINDSAIGSIIRNDTSTYGSEFALGKSRGTTVGGTTAVVANDRLGSFAFVGADGTDINNAAAYIAGDVDGAVSTGIVPGRLSLFTTDTTGTAVERMRISSAGNVSINAGGDAGYLFNSTRSDNTVYASSSSSLASPVTSSSAVLDIANSASVASTSAYIQFRSKTNTAQNYAYIGTVSTASAYSPTIVFGQRTGATAYDERMRITPDGNLSIGTTTDYGHKLNIATSSSANGIRIHDEQGGGGVTMSSYANTTASPYMFFHKARGTASAPLAAAANDYGFLLRSYALDSDAGTLREVARIGTQVDTVTGSDNISGNLKFWTRNDGAGAGLSTRMVIGRDGVITTYNSSNIVNGGLYFSSLSNIVPLEDTIAAASWDQTLAGQGNVTDLFVKPDGSKLFVAASTTITQQTFTTAWDLTGGMTAGTTLTIPWDVVTNGIYIDPTGTKLVTVGQTAVAGILPGVLASEDRAWYATLSTPWDVSTATLVSTLKFGAGDNGLVAAETAPMGVYFNTTIAGAQAIGTIMYMVGSTQDKVQQYTLTTAYDVSTATWSKEFNIANEELTSTGMTFNSNGTRMYICGTTGDDINEYRLGTAWDISTAVYYDRVYVGDRELGVSGVYVSSNYMYIGGSSSDAIQRYSLAQGVKINPQSTTGRVDIDGEVTLKTGGLIVERPVRFYSSLEVTGGTTLGTTSTGALTATTLTTSSTISMAITTTGITIGSGQTTGAILIGGTAGTGAITLGSSTGAQTVNVGTGSPAASTAQIINIGTGAGAAATASKTINIGTAGISGLTTNINIGSAVSGALGTITLNENVIQIKLKAVGTTAGAPTIASATTIAPTTQILFVSGTTAIATITAPAPISTNGGQITIIPTGVFTTTTAGNIALASTAVVSKALIMTYDPITTKWYPSY